MTFRRLFAFLICCLVLTVGCVGSEKPRRVRRGSERILPRPTPNPERDFDLEVPAKLLRSNLIRRKAVIDIERAKSKDYTNSWNSHDADVKRVLSGNLKKQDGDN